MNSEQVYITANPTPNPDALKFIVDRQIVDGDPVSYNSAEDSKGSLLAEKLFALDGVKQLFAFQNFVTVTREGDTPWQDFARSIGTTIRSHVQSGETPSFLPPETTGEGEDDGKVTIIKQVLDEIQPMVAADGGSISFAGYSDGVVRLFMQGSCAGCPSATVTLKAGIETRLREVLPEIREVVSI
jgi:Fe-S cluster biogenesis protein NfuA